MGRHFGGAGGEELREAAGTCDRVDENLQKVEAKFSALPCGADLVGLGIDTRRVFLCNVKTLVKVRFSPASIPFRQLQFDISTSCLSVIGTPTLFLSSHSLSFLYLDN